jgi:hypothetical protein
MKILKAITLFFLLASAAFAVFFFYVGKYVFLFMLVVYVIVYFVSLAKEPVIRKKEVLPDFDSDPLRQQSFPAVFNDKEEYNNKNHAKRNN